MSEIRGEVRAFDRFHTVYRRGDDVAVVHQLSLQKLFLKRADWEGHEATHLSRFRPFDLVKPATRPRVLQAVLTQACNYRCGYCTVFNNEQPAAGQTMSMEVVDQVATLFNDTVRAGNGLLILHGGEPLLNWKGLTRLVEQTCSNTVLFTNGSLLSPEKARWLAAHDVNVIVSIDGLPDVHDQQRRDTAGNTTSERTFAGFQTARDAGCVTGISLVLGPHNRHRLVDTAAEVLDRLSPDSLGVNLPHYAENYSSCEMDVDRYAADMVALFRLAKARNLYLYPVTKYVKHLVQERFKWFDCSAMGEKLVVFPNGTLSNCINRTETVPASEAGQVLDVWQHELPIYDPACRGCHALAICGGGCIYDGKSFKASAAGEPMGDALRPSRSAPPAAWDQWAPPAFAGTEPARGACDSHGFDLRFCRTSLALMEAMVWDMFDEFGYGMPTVAELEARYQCFLSQPAGSRGLRIGIGHETMDA